MVLWFSRSPGNVRDTWCVLQKPRQCEGCLMRSPEDSGCEGPADTLLILITNAHDYLSLIIVTLSLIFVIWHMKQTKPRQTRAIHRNPLEARVIKARWHFFYRHFLFLGNQEQVFLFSLLISKLIHALYLNAHFNTTQGTKCRIFFTIIETWPHRPR